MTTTAEYYKEPALIIPGKPIRWTKNLDWTHDSGYLEYRLFGYDEDIKILSMACFTYPAGRDIYEHEVFVAAEKTAAYPIGTYEAYGYYVDYNGAGCSRQIFEGLITIDTPDLRYSRKMLELLRCIKRREPCDLRDDPSLRIGRERAVWIRETVLLMKAYPHYQQVVGVPDEL